MTNNNPSCRRLVETLCPEIMTSESAQASGLTEVGLADAAVRQDVDPEEGPAPAVDASLSTAANVSSAVTVVVVEQDDNLNYDGSSKAEAKAKTLLFRIFRHRSI
ncbi:uncharacterized protein PHALS_06301 [Plasmopara halstedii]|uniref:Uncharacterized protein n=1 Tax=Plasmopara halstedii TaxID=4781 RepID=A0A0P1B216_PLAHL|nr:uncharacterized protein PHALS_06301 [Plasmopara halstedii]CEG48482.1 hypothetical protein PHALS_06301 [Plasmopara halstedii]|eukprot:XP_024584851.1 hypothetical protein PHALS_06301 [Plasmopara halstedii]